MIIKKCKSNSLLLGDDFRELIDSELINVKISHNSKVLSKGDFSEEEIKKMEKEYNCSINRYKRSKVV